MNIIPYYSYIYLRTFNKKLLTFEENFTVSIFIDRKLNPTLFNLKLSYSQIHGLISVAFLFRTIKGAVWWNVTIMANVLATGHQMAKLTKEERDLEDKNVLKSRCHFFKILFLLLFSSPTYFKSFMEIFCRNWQKLNKWTKLSGNV